MATKKRVATEIIPPGKVKVKEERVYVRDVEPELPTVAEDDGEIDPSDPLSAFSAMVDPEEQYTMRIWRLPKYEEDGRISANGSVREACGTVPFSPEDDYLIDRIREKVPGGGYVLLELTSRGKFADQGVMKLSPLPGHGDGQPVQKQTQQGPLVVMHQQPNQQHLTAPVDPMAQAEQGMSFAMKLVEMAKKLAPEPQPVTINAPTHDGQGGESRGIEDRLLETVITKAIEGDSEGKRLDKVLDALAGRSRNSGGGFDWGEMLGGITKTMMPLIAQFAMQYMARQQGQVPPGQQMITGQQGNGGQIDGGIGASTADPHFGAGSASVLPDNPADRAWVFCVRHMLENMGNGVSAKTSAGEIVDLVDQYDHMEAIAAPILEAEPAAAVELLAATVPQFVQVKDHPAALAWIAKMQTEAKAMLAETADIGVGQ